MTLILSDIMNLILEPVYNRNHPMIIFGLSQFIHQLDSSIRGEWSVFRGAQRLFMIKYFQIFC